MKTTHVRTVAIAAALVATAATLASCLSERSDGPVTTEVCNVQLPPEAFGSTIVIVRNFAFNPAQVTVSTGARVTWVNCGAPGSDSHTSTSDAAGVVGWSSPLLAPGATFTHEFTTAGSFGYHCEPHPGMTGSVLVN
jgi:plastocyanin